MKAMLPTQPYPENYLLALQAEAANEPEFPPESFGNPEEDPEYCRGTYSFLQPYFLSLEDVSIAQQ